MESDMKKSVCVSVCVYKTRSTVQVLGVNTELEV